MASKRKPAKPKQSTLAKNVNAALRGAKSAITAGRKAAEARAKKAKARADAAELARIEQFLGEDFTSLSAAKRAWARETQRVTKKQAQAFRAKQQRAAPAPAKPPKKRRPAPAGPKPPTAEAARPMPAPAGPRLPDSGSISLGELTSGTLPEVLDKLEGSLGQQLDAQLRSDERLQVTVFGRGTKAQRFFTSFRQLAGYVRRYKTKGFGNWAPTSQQDLLANIRVVRSAPDVGPAEQQVKRAVERQAEVARIRAKYANKPLLDVAIEEQARLRAENAELRALVERLLKGQK